MELLQLRYFYKIATSDTLTQAARELHVSQPSLSSMLRKLEAELGGKLFVKKGRLLKLNRRGEILLHYAEKILRELDAMKEEVNILNQNQENRLVIELQAASNLILPIIKEFQGKHEDIQIRILQNQSEKAAEDNKPDLIVTADYRKPTEDRILFKEELLLAIPENHRLAGKLSVTVEDLQEEKFILLSHGKRMRTITDYYCKKMHFKPKVILESDDIGMVKDLIRSGFGVSIIPKISWENVLGEHVQTLRIAACPCFRYVYLRENKNNCTNEAAQLFAKEIQVSMRSLVSHEPIPQKSRL